MLIFRKGVEGKIARAVIKKKIQLVSMFILGAVSGSVWLWNVQEVKVLFAERDKAEIIFENHFLEKARAEEVKVESVEDIIRRVASEKKFEDVDTLLSIARCESNMDRYAKNSISSARGLFQILDVHGLSADERNNPETATKWTIDKIRKSGTVAWNSSKLCWSK